MSHRFGFLGVFAVLVLSLASAWASNIEVVQSVPIETSLAVPGIRETQAVWLEMIGNARATLDIEQFYITDQAGQALEPVLFAIRDAAKRGVRVRLVADSKFYKSYPVSVDRIGALPNSEARIIDFSPGIQHTKFFIVDDKQVFVGSQNFDWRALSHIHEIGVRIEDQPVSAQFARIFAADWKAAKTVGASKLGDAIESLPEASGGGSELVRVVASPAQANPKGIPASLDAIVGMINSAKSLVRVQVMDYNTGGRWTVLDEAFRRAAGRGARVQLLVDVAHAKKAKAELDSLSKVVNVEVKSVTIPAWSGGAIDFARLVHSKYLIVDGAEAWVGTENWSKGYFLEARNTGVVIRVRSAVENLSRVFEKVWLSSYSSKQI